MTRGDALILFGATGDLARKEAAWRVIQPAIDDPGDVFPYERGTWGPAEADGVLAGHHWHAPTD